MTNERGMCQNLTKTKKRRSTKEERIIQVKERRNEGESKKEGRITEEEYKHESMHQCYNNPSLTDR